MSGRLKGVVVSKNARGQWVVRITTELHKLVGYRITVDSVASGVMLQKYCNVDFILKIREGSYYATDTRLTDKK